MNEHFGIELFNCTWSMHCRRMPCPLFLLCLPQPCIKSLMIVSLDAVTTNPSQSVVFHTGPGFLLYPEVTPNILLTSFFLLVICQLTWCTVPFKGPYQWFLHVLAHLLQITYFARQLAILQTVLLWFKSLNVFFFNHSIISTRFHMVWKSYLIYSLKLAWLARRHSEHQVLLS